MIPLVKLLYVPLLAVLAFAALCFVNTIQLVGERQMVDPNYPAASDLSIAVWALLIFCPARWFSVNYLFTPLGNWLLPSLATRKHWTVQSRRDRVQRFATVCFKFLYFVTMTVVGWLLLVQQDWFPSILGGSGDVKNCWPDFPHPVHPPGLKEYYMVSLAYHGQSLLFHGFMAHRNDFLEMMLHHTCAISLVLFSYFNNYVKIGSLVLFVHDIADVVGYAIKASVDTQYTKVTIVIYAMLLLVWGVTRLYIFPFYILSSIFYDMRDLVPMERYPRGNALYFEGMLYILQCLHIYWYFLFLIMGSQYLKTGKTVDILEKPGARFEKHVDAYGRPIAVVPVAAAPGSAGAKQPPLVIDDPTAATPAARSHSE